MEHLINSVEFNAYALTKARPKPVNGVQKAAAAQKEFKERAKPLIRPLSFNYCLRSAPQCP
jgi:hypothetical protein